MTSAAMLSMPLGEWQEAQGKLHAAENRVAELEKQLVETRLASGDERTTKALNALAQELITVACYAVSELPPETHHRRWPLGALRAAIELFPVMAAHNQTTSELAIELKAFVDECERWRKAEGKPAVRQRPMEDQSYKNGPDTQLGFYTGEQNK